MTRQGMTKWWLAASLPAVVHLAFFGIGVIRQGYVIFGRLDLIVLAVCVLYLALIPLFITTRRRAIAWLTMTTITLVSLVIANAFATYWMPQPILANYPWPPMHRVRQATASLGGITGPIHFSVNRMGLRGPEVSPTDFDVRILCVGGSTTECLYVSDEKSWPWKMGDILNDKTERKAYVGNAGRSGHMAAHHAYLIRNYAGIDLFDWVVVFSGINDVGAMLHENRLNRERRIEEETLFHRLRPHEPYYRPLALWRLMETVLDVGTPVADGQVFQDAAGLWIDKLRGARREKFQRHPLTTPPNTLSEALQHYRRDLLNVVDAAKGRGLKLLLVTQPVLWSKDLPSDLDRLLLEQTDGGAYSPAALEEIMQAFNNVMLDVARETETPLLDLAAVLPKDSTVFYDDCHFNDSGCDKVAGIVAKKLTELLQDAQPPASPAP